MDLGVSMRCLDCPQTVTFFGALFRDVRTYPSLSLSLSLPPSPSLLSSQTSVFPQGDVWICMELMDKSLHQLYKLVYETLHLSIPEPVVGKMAEAVSR